eukprot:gene46653-62403_t
MPSPRSTQPAEVHYHITPSDLHAHLFSVSLVIARPAAPQAGPFPVWTRGGYRVRRFAKNLQGLSVRQGKRVMPLAQLDKHRWQVACTPGKPLELTYTVCAYDSSVRTAWLDASRGFFNGTSLCLRVAGQEDQPHSLEIVASAATQGWNVVTGLTAHSVDPTGFGHYRAADYDELAD